MNASSLTHAFKNTATVTAQAKVTIRMAQQRSVFWDRCSIVSHRTLRSDMSTASSLPGVGIHDARSDERPEQCVCLEAMALFSRVQDVVHGEQRLAGMLPVDFRHVDQWNIQLVRYFAG